MGLFGPDPRYSVLRNWRWLDLEELTGGSALFEGLA
jgi:hypothetical protein